MIETSEQGGVAVLRMADGKVNAMSIDFCAEVTTKFEQILPARAVVLTGTGRIFSAGVDLLRLLDGGPDYIRQFLPALSTMLAAALPIPSRWWRRSTGMPWRAAACWPAPPTGGSWRATRVGSA